MLWKMLLTRIILAQLEKILESKEIGLLMIHKQHLVAYSSDGLLGFMAYQLL